MLSTKKIRVLHGTLEYKKRVGGVGSVTTGLTPALVKKGFDVSVVTPFFDAYLDDPKYIKAQIFTSVQHIYKGKPVKSHIYRVVSEVVAGQPIYHYLIKPADEQISRLFDIEKDQNNIYRSFPWSEGQNRREYFSSAVAAMLRLPNDHLPEFDIYHAHTWHAGLAAPIAEEMENLPKWQALYRDQKKPLRKNPHKISTIHMLLAREHGQLTTKESVADFLFSLGFPEDFTKKFDAWKQYINPGHLKQVVFAMLYCHNNTVSEGLAYEAAHIKGGGQGLDELFNWLEKHQRFNGISNGIQHELFDATNKKVLGEFAFDLNAISASKHKLKVHLSKDHAQLDPNKQWFGFTGRFAWEKGMDMLLDAADEIAKQNGVFIVMGKHVATPKIINGKQVHLYQEIIDKLRKMPHVLVIDDPATQEKIGSQIRGAIDTTLITSHNEACGLIHKENFANGAAFAIAPKIQAFHLDNNPDNGMVSLYSDEPGTRHKNLRAAIAHATEFYKAKIADGTMDQYLRNLLNYSKQLDWNSKPAKRYANMYRNVLSKPRLTYDQVRTVYRPMLSMLSLYVKSAKNKAEHLRKTKIAPNLLKYENPFKDQFEEAPLKGKVFQIGFNKCGTQTVYYGFLGSGVPSAHYGIRKQTLAAIIYDNFKHGRKLLSGIDDFILYSDMEDIYHPEMPLYIAQQFLEDLDKQYPGSKFIFNTRNKDNWLRSRFSHVDPTNGKVYSAVLCERYKCTPEELYERMSKEWDEFTQRVRKYFANRPDDFLEYNIESPYDVPQKIVDFLPSLNLDVTKFQHANKTKVEAASVVSKNPAGNSTGSVARPSMK